MPKRHVIISANPNAGARSGALKVQRLSELLTQRGYTVDLTTDVDHVAKHSEKLLSRGELHAIVAAGGDGTISLITNRVPLGVPVLPMPLGTENLLAKYLGVSSTPQSICKIIETGVVARFDAGQVGSTLFLLMFSCGFDADVVKRLHDGRDGHINQFSYAKPILQTIRKYKYPELRIRCDAAEEIIQARWAFVFNLPCYAWGLGRRMAPEAVATDGELDLLAFRQGSLSRGLLYLGGILLGKQKSMKGCITSRSQKIIIEADEPVPYELDGDPAGILPVEIEVVPERLTLIVPREWAKKNAIVTSSASRTDE